MLGDFNVTDNKIDRAPAHDDDANASDALRTLCHTQPPRLLEAHFPNQTKPHL